MSNYITNVVNILGSNDIMRKYFNVDNHFDYNLVIPISFQETQKLTQWQETNLRFKKWGKTMNAFNQKVYSHTNFTFQSVWSPPITVFKYLSLLHPELTIIINYFVVEDNDFTGGILIFKNGQVNGKTCHEPDKTLNLDKLFRHKL